jgi:hypothetical protein
VFVRWILALLLTVAASLACPCNVIADELHEELSRLKTVRPGGKDNPTAARDWQAVSQADPAKLSVILSALDDADPLGANWIRSAVEAICDRALRAKVEPPVEMLEKFALDTQHAPRARRLAYECLLRFEPQAAERLIPRFLDDPSVELRRDAVAKQITEADRVFAEHGKPGGRSDAETAAYLREVMSHARDVDQVNHLVKQLEELGQKADLPSHFGFVTEWKVIGPFDNHEGIGYDAVYPPEEQVDLNAAYPGKSKEIRWIDASTKDPFGQIDLNEALGKANGVVGYAAVDFFSRAQQPIELRIGCTNANKLWVNGQLVAANKVYHSGAWMDQYTARATLRPGRNLILLKVCQNEQTDTWAQDWKFQLRVCDAAGTAIPSQE